jgi:hypothetical protein
MNGVERLRLMAARDLADKSITPGEAADILARLDAAEAVCRLTEPYRFDTAYNPLADRIAASLARWRELTEPKPKHGVRHVVQHSSGQVGAVCECNADITAPTWAAALDAFAQHYAEATK